jgi:outer membrane autotransporter protein
MAADECGTFAGVALTCDATGNPYGSGITYLLPGSDFELILGEDILVSTGSTNGVTLSETVNDLTLRFAGDIDTTGNNNAGINMSTTSGAIVVTGVDGTYGNIVTTGTGADGIIARTEDGAISIAVQDVTTHGNSAQAIDAQSTGTGSIDITVFGDLDTQGSSSHGIRAIAGNAGLNNGGDINITTYGSIDTAGAAAAGLFARNRGGDITIMSNSDITTQGTGYADGMYVQGQAGSAISITSVGDINIENGSIAAGIYAVIKNGGSIFVDQTGDIDGGSHALKATTNGGGDLEVIVDGNLSSGIDPDNESGNTFVVRSMNGGTVTVTQTGDITNRGDGAGLIARSYQGGEIIVNQTGDITTSDVGIGTWNAGIIANSGWGNVSEGMIEEILSDGVSFDVTVNQTGTITTVGEFRAQGIRAYSKGGTVTVNQSGNIVTSGDTDSGGIEAWTYVLGTDVTIVQSGTITTHGDDSDGIEAEARGETGNISITQQSLTIDGVTQEGLISTAGENSAGIFAKAGPGTISVTAANITTAGNNAHGIYARSEGGAVSVTTDGAIATQGFGAAGVYAASGSADVVVTASGSVSTTGNYAPGLVALSRGGDAIIDGDASITTTGNNSPGAMALSYAGNASVTVGDVETSGENSAPGVLALSLVGDATVYTGSVTTLGDISPAIAAFSPNGNVMITATGTLTTSGSEGTAAFLGDAYSYASAGVLARTDAGSITINVQDIVTSGDDASGVDAETVTGALTVTAANITTAGDSAEGVEVDSESGAITVAVTGKVLTTGRSAEGLDVETDIGDITITAVDIETTGEESEGINAESDGGNVSITATGLVETQGDYAEGVKAETDYDGTITIALANVTTASIGAEGVDADTEDGDISVTVTGLITTEGEDGRGVEATSDTGAITVAVTDVSTSGASANGAHAASSSGDVLVEVAGTITATGDGSTGVFASSDSGVATVTTGPAAHIEAADNAVTLETVSGSLAVNNAGTLESGAGFAIMAIGGATSVDSSGIINGRVQLSAFDDVLSNSGSFNADADSDFGDGIDSFVNNGIVRVHGTVTFTGLESFTNNETVDLQDMATDDHLVLPGTYDANSFLAIDVSADGAGSSDTLVVAGAATGETTIIVNDVSTSPNFGIEVMVVDAGAGTAADAFVLPGGSVEIGFLNYNLSFEAAENDFYLTTSVGSAVFRSTKVAEGAQSLWYRSADAWGAHMTSLRDAETSHQTPVWLQVYAARAERDDSYNGTAGGNSGSVSLDYDQSYLGFQLGYEMGFGERGQGTTIGVTAGYLNSNLNFDGFADRVHYEAFNIGIYAGYQSDGFFANALIKNDFIGGDITATAPGYGADVDGNVFGVRLEAGYRWESEKLFVEPIASLEYQNASIDDVTALGASFNYSNWDGLRGSAGLRAGTEVDVGAGSTLTAYLGGRAVREFAGDGDLAFTTGGSNIALTNEPNGTYGRFELGLNLLTQGGISGFVSGNYDAGSDYEGYGGRVGLRLSF